MRILLLTSLFFAKLTMGDVLPVDAQVAQALLAAPADLRDGAAVLGYSADGKLMELRAGKNELICLASDPSKTVFSVACYHRDLAAFMERGRQLLADKVTGTKRNDVRWKEIEEGKLKMPREPRTLYVLTGSGYDVATTKVADPYERWVIYLPFATSETTGLSTKPSDNAPWLMFPGTAGAHIMISPARK